MLTTFPRRERRGSINPVTLTAREKNSDCDNDYYQREHGNGIGAAVCVHFFMINRGLHWLVVMAHILFQIG